MNLKDFLGIIRAPFLILAPMCVLLGVATAYNQITNLNIFHVILVFLGGLFAHISVNSLNEYFDFKNGLDYRTIKTPFSGGSGTLISKPYLSTYALIIGVSSAFIVTLIGIYFVYLRYLPMLLIGLLGLLMVIFYPVSFVKNPILSLISPGLGFGTAMVLGTHIALGGTITIKEIFVSIVPFFLVNNLLLLNQFPDKEPDESVGRKNIVILFGRKRAAYIYLLFNLMAYITIISGIVFGILGIYSLLGLITIVFAIPASLKTLRNSDDLRLLLPSQGMNVIVNLLTPLMLAIGLLL